MPGMPPRIINGEVRQDLLFIRLTATEKARIRQLTKELDMPSMSETVRYLTNTYYEIAHTKPKAS